MTVYIGIDAGTKSGFCLLGPNDTVPALYEYGDIDELVDDTRNLMYRGTPTVIFYEKFTISARTIKTAVVYDTLLFNGWLHHEGARFPYIKTQGFTPAQSKGFSTDAKLKHLDWYSPTKGGHQNDAARVMLLGMAKAGDARVINSLKGMV
jgi:hypothetical protein